jgi:hypothetical protein
VHIGYITECVPAYRKVVDDATNWESLIEAISPYKLVANDAIQCALKEAEGGEKSWLEFREGLAKERKSRFAGEEWMKRFADILLPTTMFKVSVVAEQFKVPWGMAYIRLKEVGRLKEKRGVALLDA